MAARQESRCKVPQQERRPKSRPRKTRGQSQDQGRGKAKTKARKAQQAKTTCGRDRPRHGRRIASAASSASASACTAIGFGDFFLLTVPGNDGPAHILIDCGVHAANIGSIDDVRAGPEEDDQQSLGARHPDALSRRPHVGVRLELRRLRRLRPCRRRLDHQSARSGATRGRRSSWPRSRRWRRSCNCSSAPATMPTAKEAQRKVHNALGVELGAAAVAAAATPRRSKLLQSGLQVQAAGLLLPGRRHADLAGGTRRQDHGRDPGAVAEGFGRRILGERQQEGTVSRRRRRQRRARMSTACSRSRRRWPASATDYPGVVFEEFDTGCGRAGSPSGAAQMEALLQGMQPDVLAATADKLDGTLNNQSLVVLFTCQGKKLLFVGDAQWGNWAYWLYGKAVSRRRSRHHGSAPRRSWARSTSTRSATTAAPTPRRSPRSAR